MQTAAPDGEDDAGDRECQPADIGEANRRNEQRRQGVLHHLRGFGARASGSYRSTNAKTTKISPKSVPNMMSAAMETASWRVAGTQRRFFRLAHAAARESA